MERNRTNMPDADAINTTPKKERNYGKYFGLKRMMLLKNNLVLDGSLIDLLEIINRMQNDELVLRRAGSDGNDN